VSTDHGTGESGAVFEVEIIKVATRKIFAFAEEILGTAFVGTRIFLRDSGIGK